MKVSGLKLSFFADGVDYTWEKKPGVVKWLNQVVLQEEGTGGQLNFIMTSDPELLNINKKFLKHDFLTDIITFQDSEGIVSGEVYLSMDRIAENAKVHAVDFDHELSRVMVHGVLHMIGYGDKNSEQKKIMRSKEDFYLNLRGF